MTVTAVTLRYSYAEYVRFERDAHERHEFVGGLILAMAGGTLEHARLSASIIAMLSSQLEGKRCAVFDSNARVRVPSTGNAYYPDVSVVCGEAHIDPEDGISMTNPAVVVEVLSPSTAEYDRTDKLADYQKIPSVRHIVHVAHDETRVDVFSASAAGWSVATYRPGESAVLEELGCTLDVAALYRNPLAAG